MEHVAVIMILFAGAPDVPKIDIGSLPVSLEECRAFIRDLGTPPPGRRAYCAKVKIEWYAPKRNC